METRKSGQAVARLWAGAASQLTVLAFQAPFAIVIVGEPRRMAGKARLPVILRQPYVRRLSADGRAHIEAVGVSVQPTPCAGAMRSSASLARSSGQATVALLRCVTASSTSSSGSLLSEATADQ